METVGRLVNITRDFMSGKLNVTFQINTEPIDELNTLATIDAVDITAKKHRKKRSLDANAYAWILMSKIAEKHRISKEEVYEQMLRDYGTLYCDDEGYITMTVKANVNMARIEGHWKYYKGNDQWASYIMIKGSSKYDTAEMSRFIEGIVYECKEEGIETIPPAELKRMMSVWKPKEVRHGEEAVECAYG